MKNTDDLQQELMEAHDLDQFLSDNEENFINNSVCELLSLLFRKRNISKATPGMSEVYLHQVFAGRRNPSRSRLLCLCFGLQTTVVETQEAPKAVRLCPSLYQKPAGCHHSVRYSEWPGSFCRE